MSMPTFVLVIDGDCEQIDVDCKCGDYDCDYCDYWFERPKFDSFD